MNVVKSALGLHTSPGAQLSAWQGLSTQEPRLHALPQPWQGKFQQLSTTHEPAFGPHPVQARPGSQVTLKHGSWQPFWPLQTQTGGWKQLASSVPAGAQSTVWLASTTVFVPQSPQSASKSVTQNLPRTCPVSLDVTVSHF